MLFAGDSWIDKTYESMRRGLILLFRALVLIDPWNHSLHSMATLCSPIVLQRVHLDGWWALILDHTALFRYRPLLVVKAHLLVDLNVILALLLSLVTTVFLVREQGHIATLAEGSAIQDELAWHSLLRGATSK